MLTLLLIPLVVVVRADTCPEPKTPFSLEHTGLLKINHRFSAELVQTVVKQNPTENVFLSPLGVYKALLITYFSSGGSTAKALRKTLHIPDDKDINVVAGDYLQTKRHLLDDASRNYTLSSVNRIYVSDKLKVRDCMKKLFHEELQETNFVSDSSGAVKQINSWVAEQTNDMIPILLPENSLDSTTKIALVNAAYFNASWESKFPNPAEQGNFSLANGTTVPVMMMQQTSQFKTRYDSELDCHLLELPYEGGEVSMFIALPNKPSLSAISDLLNQLNEESMRTSNTKLAQTHPVNVEVHIPKFTVEREYDLKPILSSMGAGSLFDGSADFSTLFENSSGIAISAAIHKTKIRMTEQGTEAAGGTAIASQGTPIYSVPPVLFRANHPFIYSVFDKPAKLFLFSGIFNSP